MAVTVTGTYTSGIYAKNSKTANDLTINTSTVNGGVGIYAINNGTGDTSITSNGTVTSTKYIGISAMNGETANNLIINTRAVSGESRGISAYNKGTGKTSITSNGTVTSNGTKNGLQGIYVKNAKTASDLSVNVTSVSSVDAIGIYAHNKGTGKTSITSTGAVNGLVNGINVNNFETATSLTINTVDINGSAEAINAINSGTGATNITSKGTLNGGAIFGVRAKNNETASSLTITTANVKGQQGGIKAINNGTGETNITNTGTITGTYGVGIEVSNAKTASSLTISAAGIVGRYGGITAINLGSGATTITVNGAVKGGTGTGINSQTEGNAATINLNYGASVSASSGNAITNNEGDSIININNGASITGKIKLGDGRDHINFNGGDFSRVTLFDGGAGTNDSLAFAGSSGRFNQGLMRNIESVTVDRGSTIGFTGNAFNTNTLIIQNGGIVNAPNGFAPMGNLINRSGILSLQNGIVGDNVNVGGHYTGGGQLRLDVNFATNTADQLNVAGNVLAGGTQVRINDHSTGYATGAGITVATVGGTTNPGNFILANPTVKGAFNYNTIGLVGQNWQLQSRNPFTGGSAFTPIAGSFEAISQSLLTLEKLPNMVERHRSRLGGANSGDGLGIDTPIWMRMVGGNREIDSDSSSTGSDIDTDHWRAQLGVDFIVTDNSNGQLSFGINGSYSQADTDIDSRSGNSNIDSDGYSIGVSTTWQSTQGYYIDLQAQKSWYESDFSAGGAGAGHINNVDSDGHSASIEIGQAFSLSNSLEITPHAQLVYAKIDTDKFIGANAEIVRLSKGKSLKARFGANLNKQFSEDGGTHGYLLANVIHEFKDETETKVSGLTLTNSVDQWSAEAGAGISHQWDQGNIHYKLNAEVTGSSSLNNIGEISSIQGGVGFKVNF